MERLTKKVTSKQDLKEIEGQNLNPHTDRLLGVYQACLQMSVTADISWSAKLESGGNSEEEASTAHCDLEGERAILEPFPESALLPEIWARRLRQVGFWLRCDQKYEERAWLGLSGAR